MKSFIEIYVQNSFVEIPREIRYVVKNKKLAQTFNNERHKQRAMIGKIKPISFKMVDLKSKVTE